MHPVTAVEQRLRDSTLHQESKGRHWATADQLLKRLVEALGTVLYGCDAALDARLQEMARSVRVTGIPELHRSLAELSDALIKGNRADSGRPVEAAALITQFIEHLAVPPEVQAQLAQLKQQTAAATSVAELGKALQGIATLVNELRMRLQNEKLDVQRLLHQLTSRLEEVSTFVAGEAADRQAGQGNNDTLNSVVLSEVQRLHGNIEQAEDLPALKNQVRVRVEAIAGHLTEFRQREAEREQAYESRASQMRRRIEELERESRGLNESLEREHRSANTDGLTRIANRLAYDKQIAVEHGNCLRDGNPLSLAVFDVDHFKTVNDNYGHQAGDKILVVLARYLQRNIRDCDFVARYGGEEFVVILHNTASAEAMKLSGARREAISRIAFQFGPSSFNVTVSCGIATFSADDTPERVFARADAALYQAKKAGRNRCVMG